MKFFFQNDQEVHIIYIFFLFDQSQPVAYPEIQDGGGGVWYLGPPLPLWRALASLEIFLDQRCSYNRCVLSAFSTRKLHLDTQCFLPVTFHFNQV